MKPRAAGVVDDGGEQYGRRIPPAGIGEPGALIKAHATGHLERHHGGDDEVVASEFVYDHLIGRVTTNASAHEAIERGKEARAASPLRLVKVAQGVEAPENRRTSDRPMSDAFGRKAVGGTTEVATELRGQGGTVGLHAVGQRYEGGHGHRLPANTAGQGFDQPRPGPDTLEVQEAPSRTTEPVPEEADHLGLVAGGGQQVEMIRAQRTVSHHPECLSSGGAPPGQGRRGVAHRRQPEGSGSSDPPVPASHHDRRKGDGRGEESTSRSHCKAHPSSCGTSSRMGWATIGYTLSDHDRGGDVPHVNCRPMVG